MLYFHELRIERLAFRNAAPVLAGGRRSVYRMVVEAIVTVVIRQRRCDQTDRALETVEEHILDQAVRVRDMRFEGKDPAAIAQPSAGKDRVAADVGADVVEDVAGTQGSLDPRNRSP